MGNKFYFKIALNNLKKNHKTYVPYVIMGVFLVAMYFMMHSLYRSESVLRMKEGNNVVILLGIGIWVIRIFSVIFLFYINSFLIKRRTQEIGLYNILGMEKKHIAKMMLIETLYIELVDIIAGVVIGVTFGKLLFLVLVKLIGSKQIPNFAIPFKTLWETVIFFMILFTVIFVFNLLKIHLTNPIEMLHGKEIAEREPKSKLLITLIGVASIGWGYYFALMSDKPLKVMNLFLIAVIAVIIGTYCIFISGSIVMIKLLKRWDKFYYRPNNFTSVSGMLYRMKQNAVGMANICILSTMALVSVSTTVCLYLGMDDSVKNAYSREENFTIEISNSNDVEKLDKVIENVNKKNKVKVNDEVKMCVLNAILENTNNNEYRFLKKEQYNLLTEKSVDSIYFISLNDFNRINKSNYKLRDDEILFYSTEKKSKENELNVNIFDSVYNFKVKECLKEINSVFDQKSESSFIIVDIIIVNDIKIIDGMNNVLTANDVTSNNYNYMVLYNTNLSREKSKKLCKEMSDVIRESTFIYGENIYEIKEEMMEMYGGFLFIGIFVSIIFITATGLIIYYKQISEGYDDRKRFVIMQKVGMSSSEVKRTIKKQVLMVFILPIIVAAIHVAVSFRIFKMILNLLSFSNTGLFGICTLVTVLVFTIIYVLMYILTSGLYYKIVKIK